MQGLAAATAWMAMSGAGASVTTGIEVSAFRVELKTLAPGAVAAVSFSSDVGSTSESDCSSGPPPIDQRQSFASGLAFGQAMTTTSADPFAGGAAAISGNAFGAGAVIHTSAYASSLVAQSLGEATIGLVDDVSTATFMLAPWTLMTISAQVHASASSTGAGAFEVADSGVLMAIGDSGGTGPQFAYVNFNAFAFGGLGAVDDVESAFLSLSYVNASDVAIGGVFSGYVASYASSGAPVSAVPEPAGAAMLMIGLLALGATSMSLSSAHAKGRHAPAFLESRAPESEVEAQPSDVSVTASSSCERSTSSTKAIGALSPLRKPIFRMRV